MFTRTVLARYTLLLSAMNDPWRDPYYINLSETYGIARACSWFLADYYDLHEGDNW